MKPPLDGGSAASYNCDTTSTACCAATAPTATSGPSASGCDPATKAPPTGGGSQCQLLGKNFSPACLSNNGNRAVIAPLFTASGFTCPNDGFNPGCCPTPVLPTTPTGFYDTCIYANPVLSICKSKARPFPACKIKNSVPVIPPGGVSSVGFYCILGSGVPACCPNKLDPTNLPKGSDCTSIHVLNYGGPDSLAFQI